MLICCEVLVRIMVVHAPRPGLPRQAAEQSCGTRCAVRALGACAAAPAVSRGDTGDHSEVPGAGMWRWGRHVAVLPT